MNGLQDMVFIGPRGNVDIQFLGQGTHQGFRPQIGVRQIRGKNILVQRLQQAPTQQCFSCPDLTGNLDEPFTRIERHQQGIQGLLMALGKKSIAGVRRNSERQFFKSEKIQIHNTPYSEGGCSAWVFGAGTRSKPCSRVLTSSRSRVQELAFSITVGLIRITNSRFFIELALWPASVPHAD